MITNKADESAANRCEPYAEEYQKPRQRRRKREAMPVRATMCATCPFREGQKQEFAQLAGVLTERVLSTASHICHSTGSNNAFYRRTGYKPALCRGARDIQLKVFAATRFIKEPTDEAWNQRCVEMNLPPIEVIKQPMPNTKP